MIFDEQNFDSVDKCEGLVFSDIIGGFWGDDGGISGMLNLHGLKFKNIWRDLID
jgi:hypothetical protein